jgi:succinate-semialdehyde dehydrogenase/glutarate-semialdehyde dehydrogenase
MTATKFQSVNPYNEQVISEYESLNDAEIVSILNRAGEQFKDWSTTSFSDRAKLMHNVAALLRENDAEYARLISLEMGKPITEAIGEVNKCAWVCDYYAEHAATFLQNEVIKTDAQKSFVRHDPLGCILAIMPWNFPFWQVFRFAAPTLMAGNVAVLKHAPNVFGSANMIAEIFLKAGFPAGVFQNMIFHHEKTEIVLSHEAVKAVSLTGSSRAGAAVAAMAGKLIKKSLLELGGSNAFIVLEDANIDEVVETAMNARMMNAGQSCIAAKRFILVGNTHDRFVEKFVDKIKSLKSGDPLDESTQLGTLARIDLADQLQSQIQRSIESGAQLLCGGGQKRCYHEPTVLDEVKPGMPAFDEETFGPLAAMIRATDEEEAIALSEMSNYGLGVTICTQDVDKALNMASKISDGAVFINELVKSDPRLPFGGTKGSGYGRELSRDGILEFVNRKVVYVK